MRTLAWLRISVSMVGLFCGSAYASVEDMFADIEAPPAKNGLVLEIAVPKHTYFMFEPVTVFARFRNTQDTAIALVFEEDGMKGIASKINWNFSAIDGKHHRPDTVGSTVENMLLIPAGGSIYLALPDKLFPAGTTEASIEYKHSRANSQARLADAEVWEGAAKSNTIVITSKNKEKLTPEEQKQVTDKISRHIEVFRGGDRVKGYLAQSHLIALSKYSVPILVMCLKDKDVQVRAHAIETLGKIANKELAERNGFVRDVSSFDDLVAAYDREREPWMKQRVIAALGNFDDMAAENQRRLVETARKALDHPDKGLRAFGASALLRVSPKDGIGEIIDKMADDSYFGNDQWDILNALKKATGQDFGTSSSQWQKWWRENRDIVEDQPLH